MAVAAGLPGGAKVGQMSGVAVALGCTVAVGVADTQGLSRWEFDPLGGLPPPEPQALIIKTRAANTPAASKALPRRRIGKVPVVFISLT